MTTKRKGIEYITFTLVEGKELILWDKEKKKRSRQKSGYKKRNVRRG